MLPSHPSWIHLFMKYLKSTSSTQGLCYLYNEGHKGQDSSCLEEANIWEGWQVEGCHWEMTAQPRWHFSVSLESRGGHVLLPTERRIVIICVTIRSVFLRSWSAFSMLSTSICWKLKDLGSRRWQSPTELKEHGSHALVHRQFPGDPVVMGASLVAQW